MLVRIAYFGTDGMAACAEALLSAGHTIAIVFTRRDRGARMRALAARRGTPVCLRPVTRRDVERLPTYGVDLLVCAGYPQRIPVKGDVGVRALNIHPSLLPVGRGPWPYPHVILRCLTETGVTVHEMDAEFDTGPVIHQVRIPVWPDERLESLRTRSRAAAVSALLEVMDDFELLWRTRCPQPAGSGSWWAWPTAQERTLDWAAGVADADRVARAFGSSGIDAWIAGRRVVTSGLYAWREDHGRKPGDLLLPGQEAPIVAVRDGWVCLTSARSPHRDSRARLLARRVRGRATGTWDLLNAPRPPG